MKKWTWSLLISSVLFGNACQNASEKNAGEKITVAVAASAQYPLQAIKRAFERKTGTKVELAIGSSGKLSAQIIQGAPYDVFLSADMNFPDTLAKDSLTFDPPVEYALGTLVLWTCKDIDLTAGLRVLNDPSVKKVAIANPVTAPYGRAALDVMSNSNVYNLDLHQKIVYGESIAQVNQYVTAGNCEIGITAKSVVLSPEMKGKGKWVAIRAGYSPLPHGMVLLMYGMNHHPQGSQAFYAFMLSDEVRTILTEYGYELPNKRFEPQEK